MDRSFEEDFFDEKEPQITSVELKVTSPPTPQQSSTILVQNLSRDITQKDIGEFFSFCGNISALSVTPDLENDNNVRAIITFANPSMARIALLLNNSNINPNCKITVTEFTMDDIDQDPVESIESQPNTTELSQNNSNDFEKEAQSSIIGNIIDKGYQISGDALQKAKNIDDTYAISTQVNQQWTNLAQKVDSLDREYQVTEKSKQLHKSFTDGYKQLDNTYNITGKVEGVGNTVYGFLSGAASAVSSSITVASGTVDKYIESHPDVKNAVNSVQEASINTYKSITDVVSPRGTQSPQKKQ
jgi:RNA recognition motif-containing protein